MNKKTLIIIEKSLEDTHFCEICLNNPAEYKVSVSTSNNVLYVCSLHSTDDILEYLTKIDFNVRNSSDVSVILCD